jgi:hypothetical protein
VTRAVYCYLIPIYCYIHVDHKNNELLFAPLSFPLHILNVLSVCRTVGLANPRERKRLAECTFVLWRMLSVAAAAAVRAQETKAPDEGNEEKNLQLRKWLAGKCNIWTQFLQRRIL